MPSRLIIVESPSKARTLSRFLGSEYTVLASMGHVRDLPKSKLGVDVDAGFTPVYEPLASRKKVLAELRAAAKDATDIYVATDPDRPVAAIPLSIDAWNLSPAPPTPARRVEPEPAPADADLDHLSDDEVEVLINLMLGLEEASDE